MKKKSILYISTVLFVLGILLGACSHEEVGGEGEVRLSFKTDEIVSVSGLSKTKADGESVDYTIRIYSGDGLIRKYVNEMPGSLWLQSGTYKVTVEVGTAQDAVFNATPYFKGEEAFTVPSGGSVSVAVTCHIANTLVTVAFDPTVVSNFTDYSAEVFTTKGRLTFTAENADDVAYFMLPEGETTLGWSFTATAKTGEPFTQASMINNACGGKKYALTFGFEEADYANGGGILDLKVDETALVKNDKIIVYMRPSITGQSFDITQPLYVEVGKGDRQVVWVNTSSQLMSTLVTGIPGISAAGIDFMQLSDVEKQALSAAGISVDVAYDASVDQSAMKIEFSELFFANLTEGEYNIDITARDMQEKSFMQRFSIVSSNAVVMTTDVDRASIWTSKAVLKASILQPTTDVLSFQYRESGVTDWTTVSATQSGDVMTADVSGLKPNTEYQYRAVAGSFVSTVTKTFTTEEARQLDNASFERWSEKSDGTYLVYGSGEDMFWDTGNHGSMSMSSIGVGTNLTTYTTSYVKDGSYSIQLRSQFVGLGSIGKFAAGNVFIGKYIRTSGTDGVLGWGRAFASRPKSLKCWVKYVSTAVTKRSNDCPSELGDTDQGQIYIAIGDWTGETDSDSGETWPVIIKTKSSERQLFDSTSPSIIAYGEKTFTESTAGDGLIEVEIPLDYRSLDRVPTSIVVVASASKYGDYFSGGEGATMYIDDMQLIYE